MSEPRIYVYANGNVEKLTLVPKEPIHRMYSRSYEDGKVEVKRTMRGTTQIFRHQFGGFFGNITEGKNCVVLIPYGCSREKDKILKGLLQEADLESLLKQHGNNRRIVVLDEKR